MTADLPTVLIVEDEPELRELLTTFVRPKYKVKTAETGEVALELVDSADVMLLDRRLPGMMGTAVLELIRESGNDIPVAMLTAVDPSFDILEMNFDDYLTKPIGQQELLTLIEGLVRRVDVEDVFREYLAIASKLRTIESEMSMVELERNAAYGALQDRFETVRQDAQATLDGSVQPEEVGDLLTLIES